MDGLDEENSKLHLDQWANIPLNVNVVFHHVPLRVPQRNQSSQSDVPSTSTSTSQTDVLQSCDCNQDTDEASGSRDDMICTNLQKNLIYISHCIKPTDILSYMASLFTDEEKSRIRAETTDIHKTRLALEILIYKDDEKGRFVQLRDVLFEFNVYPKIVEILDGKFDPKDQNYVKIVELFTPEIIERLDPGALLPYLGSQGVFRQTDKEEISAENTNYGAVRASCLLLLHLPRRVAYWFEVFLKALIKCDLSDLAQMLDPDLYEAITTEETDEGAVHKKLPPRQKPPVPPKPGTMATNNNNLAARRQPHLEEEKMLRLSICEYDVEKIEILTKSPSDRQTIDKSMAEDDAEIIWPDVERGQPYFMIRCTSQEDECVECTDKISTWKGVVKSKFNELLNKFVASRTVCTASPHTCESNVNKILAYPGKVNANKTYRQKCHLRNYTTGMSVKKERDSDTLVKSVFSGDQTCTQQSFETLLTCKTSDGRTFHVVQGSLEEIPVDVIVSPADRHLRLNAGLSATISMKGGAAMQQKCLQYVQFHKSMDEADAIVTEPGNLPAEKVILVVSPVFRDDKQEYSVKMLKTAVMNALSKSSQSKAASISIPAISCGISGFPTKFGTSIIVQAVKNFFMEEQESSLKTVYFVNDDCGIVKRFHEAVQQTFEDDKSCTITKSFSTLSL